MYSQDDKDRQNIPYPLIPAPYNEPYSKVQPLSYQLWIGLNFTENDVTTKT